MYMFANSPNGMEASFDKPINKKPIAQPISNVPKLPNELIGSRNIKLEMVVANITSIKLNSNEKAFIKK